MVFGRAAEAFTSASSRSSGNQQSSSVSYMSSGFPPQPPVSSGSKESSFGGNSGRKTSLRISSSLQDFSTYNRLDPEEGSVDLDARNNRLLKRENGSSFSKEKALNPGISFFPKKWVRNIIIILSLFLFGFSVMMIAFYFFGSSSYPASKYYVVLDCGSTGTRVYVYEASYHDKNDGTFPIVMKPLTEGLSRKSGGRAYDRMETEPGLDKLVHNVSGLNSAIKPLIKWAEKQIPDHAHKTTSLFLYATAGVRKLPNTDSTLLLDNAWSILKKSRFSCKREWVKIISGTDEAYYGWTALNYGTAMLGPGSKTETFGALDLGGSSLQVTFENEENVHNETNLNLRIGSVNHHLTAYSLSGFGLNDAFERSVVQLVKTLPNVSNNANIEINHPCLQSGYTDQYICSHCESIFQQTGSPLAGARSSVKGGKKGILVKLIGAPNWQQCSALAKIAINYSEWAPNPALDCDLQPCSLPDNFPRPRGQFYAVSGFFVVFRFFNLTTESSLDDVLEKGNEFCAKTWEVAKNSVHPQPFIEQYCFRAPYIVSLLREGLHLSQSQIKVGSGSITWTLGVALLESGNSFSTKLRLPSYEMFQLKLNAFMVVIILIVSLILLVCTLSCVCNWMPRFFRRSYLPIFSSKNASTVPVLNIPSPFKFHRWSHVNSGDGGRVKAPLSPTVGQTPNRPFGLGQHGSSGNSSNIQLMESPLYSSTNSVSHSYSSSSLGQMQFDNGGMGSFWSPHRSQMNLQSRRSQSREDLNSSLADAHMVKV